MESIASDHKYDQITPTRHSKNAKNPRKVALVKTSVAIVTAATLVIVVAVCSSFIKSADHSFGDDSRRARGLTNEANKKLKKVVNPMLLCAQKNVQDECYYSESGVVEDCSGLLCIKHYDGIKFSNRMVKRVRSTGTEKIVFDDINMDGVPCGVNQLCYKKACVKVNNEKLKNELRSMKVKNSTSADEMAVDYDEAQCFKLEFSASERQRLNPIIQNDGCFAKTKTAVKLKAISCVSAPHGPYKHCHVDEGEWIPIAYEVLDAACGNETLATDYNIPFHLRNNNPVIVDCVLKTSLSEYPIREPYKCNIGYCFYGLCVPVVKFFASTQPTNKAITSNQTDN